MKNTIHVQYLKTRFGELILGAFEEQLCLCDWRFRKMRALIDERIKKNLQADFVEEESAVIEESKLQLQQYFEAIRTSFKLPILLLGSDFQKSIWNLLLQIPYGQTDTYLGLSKKLGNEKAIRAVAAANGANALSIIVPCHRIIGSDGQLVGYAGGLPAKEKLLILEKALPNHQLGLFEQ